MDLLTKNVSKLSGRFIHVEHNLDEMIKQADEIQKKGLYTLRLASLDGLIE
jgi:hypothetical protein